MSTRVVSGAFRHDGDCRPAGCPDHVMEVRHQNTADIFSVYVDGNRAYIGDIGTTTLMIELLGNFEDELPTGARS